MEKAWRLKCQQQNCTSWRHPVSPTQLLHSKGLTADGEGLYITLWTTGTKVYPLSLFVFNCREGRTACSLAEGKKNLPNYIGLKTFIFSFLTPPTWKTKTQLNLLYSFWRWEGTYLSPAAMEINTTFITGCNSTHLIQKHMLVLLSCMKGLMVVLSTA